ncbi:MAG: hypothetical protein NT010_15120 [Proteobacteria bacterium]|nr:hypothetical protein [Pseudomonadota bacterium]
MNNRLRFKGELSTTAMGIMPHIDIDAALKCALGVDVPFWPQLPRISFYEDMYVQAMENFPGIVMDKERLRIFVDTDKFMEDIPAYLEKEDDPDFFRILDRNSLVYRHFLSQDLAAYKSIRGQVISPVSLALKIVDENDKPIVYNDEMRTLVFSFIKKKINVQYKELKTRNENAFVWLDDPGLEFIFNAMCGYENVRAKKEVNNFFENIEGPRGLHLCGRPDWDFILSLNIEILSFNAYAFGDIFVTYDKVKEYLERGNLISWGIVPTYYEEFSKEDVKSISDRLMNMWEILEKKGIDREMIIENSLLAPATCNLLNPDRTATVENAFKMLKEVSFYLRDEYLKN